MSKDGKAKKEVFDIPPAGGKLGTIISWCVTAFIVSVVCVLLMFGVRACASSSQGWFSSSKVDESGVTHYYRTTTVSYPTGPRWDVSMPKVGIRATTGYTKIKKGEVTPWIHGWIGDYDIRFTCRDCEAYTDLKEKFRWECDPPYPDGICAGRAALRGVRVVALEDREISLFIERTK